MDIYNKLDDILKNRGMSRRQLANDAGIPPTTLQSVFARKKNMTIEMLLNIAKVLNVDIITLLGKDAEFLLPALARQEVFEAGIESLLQSLAKLPASQSGFPHNLVIALEKVLASDSPDEILNQFYTLVNSFGRMTESSLEMHIGSDQRDNYILFIQYYQSCLDTINESKNILIEDVIDFRKDDTKFRELIYGKEGDPDGTV